MPHKSCPAKPVKCKDRSCLQYNKHWMCSAHPLHIGDVVCDKHNGWKGYVYDANPWGSKRSVYIMWNTPHHDEGKMRAGKLYLGYASCNELELCPEPRKPESLLSRT
jgi:hypothetical protein